MRGLEALLGQRERGKPGDPIGPALHDAVSGTGAAESTHRLHLRSSDVQKVGGVFFLFSLKCRTN